MLRDKADSNILTSKIPTACSPYSHDAGGLKAPCCIEKLSKNRFQANESCRVRAEAIPKPLQREPFPAQVIVGIFRSNCNWRRALWTKNYKIHKDFPCWENPHVEWMGDLKYHCSLKEPRKQHCEMSQDKGGTDDTESRQKTAPSFKRQVWKEQSCAF